MQFITERWHAVADVENFYCEESGGG